MELRYGVMISVPLDAEEEQQTIWNVDGNCEGKGFDYEEDTAGESDQPLKYLMYLPANTIDMYEEWAASEDDSDFVRFNPNKILEIDRAGINAKLSEEIARLGVTQLSSPSWHLVDC